MTILNAVVDLSHWNAQVDFAQAKAAGLLGAIHKATQGPSGAPDPHYADRQKAAQSAGLWWGAYHFGTGADGVQQAEHFLQVVGKSPQTLLVLDLEQNTTGSSMTLEEARAFVTHIYQETGRWPGLYSGSYIKEQLGSHSDKTLANCWFWLAQYGSTPVVPANWPTWTMWQYTDGANGPDPHTLDGIGRCDRDKFNGAEDQLRRLWLG